jgi:hypothetical protein
MPAGDQRLDQTRGEAVRREQRTLLAAAADLQLVAERFVQNVEFKIT